VDRLLTFEAIQEDNPMAQNDLPPMGSAEPTEPMQPASEVRYGPPVQPVAERERVREAPPVEYAARPSATYRLIQLVYLFFGIVEALIAIRVVMKLLAANPEAAFTQFLYGITDPFVAPFQGVFSEPQSHGSVLELSSLLAIIIYALLAYVIVRVIAYARGRQPTATM
jgi:YggT family protein